MQHLREPLRELLVLPHASQAGLRVAARALSSPLWQYATSASPSSSASCRARFMPFAAIGAARWAESPARYSRPYAMGSTT